MLRLIKSFLLICFFISFLFPQKKMDFRSESEQIKDPKIAMKRSLIFPSIKRIAATSIIRSSSVSNPVVSKSKETKLDRLRTDNSSFLSIFRKTEY